MVEAKKKAAKKKTVKKTVAKKKQAKKQTQKASKAAKKSNKPEIVVSDEKSSSKNATWFLVGALVVIAAIIIGGVYLPQYLEEKKTPSDLSSYNNFEFSQDEEGHWYVRLGINDQIYNIIFYYHPTEVEDIRIDDDAYDVINKAASRVLMGDEDVRLVMALNPDEENFSSLVVASIELTKVVSESYHIYNIPTSSAITKPYDGLEEHQMLTCGQATNDTIVIYVRTADVNAVGVAAQNPHCIVVQGKTSKDVIRSADRFAYELLEVMRES